MPFILDLPADQPVTRFHVADALLAAFRCHPMHRDALSAWVMTWPALYLAGHPLERAAVYDRGRAALTDLSLSEWLRAFERKERTHHRNWARGCERMAVAINTHRQSLAVARATYPLTVAEAVPEA